MVVFSREKTLDQPAVSAEFTLSLSLSSTKAFQKPAYVQCGLVGLAQLGELLVGESVMCEIGRHHVDEMMDTGENICVYA